MSRGRPTLAAMTPEKLNAVRGAMWQGCPGSPWGPRVPTGAYRAGKAAGTPRDTESGKAAGTPGVAGRSGKAVGDPTARPPATRDRPCGPGSGKAGGSGSTGKVRTKPLASGRRCQGCTPGRFSAPTPTRPPGPRGATTRPGLGPPGWVPGAAAGQWGGLGSEPREPLLCPETVGASGFPPQTQEVVGIQQGVVAGQG